MNNEYLILVVSRNYELPFAFVNIVDTSSEATIHDFVTA